MNELPMGTPPSSPPNELIDDIVLTEGPIPDSIDIPFSSIPLFEKSDLDDPNSVRDIGEAFRKSYAIGIHIPGLSAGQKKIEDLCQAFFSLPKETKCKYANDPLHQDGYTPLMSEWAPLSEHPDKKEIYSIPPNPQCSPTEIPGFKEALKKDHEMKSEIAKKISVVLLEYLRNPEAKIHLTHPHNISRFSNYPQVDNSEQPLTRPHTDLNADSLFFGKDLEFQEPDGSWNFLEIPDDYVVAIIGDQFEMLSAGYLKAPVHQVYSDDPRQGNTFYGSFNPDFLLQPFANCMEKMGVTDVKPALTVDENLHKCLIEMKVEKNPSQEMLKALDKKGALKRAPQEIKDRLTNGTSTT